MALRKLQTEHPTIDAVQCDITARPNVLALVETIRDRYSMLDVLLNNPASWNGLICWRSLLATNASLMRSL